MEQTFGPGLVTDLCDCKHERGEHWSGIGECGACDCQRFAQIMQLIAEVFRPSPTPVTVNVRQQCQGCGDEVFAIYYDSKAQGCHIECSACGEVFFL